MIQIDSVNVVVRSQELPLFARLGPHPRTLIADASHAGELFEYWVHEASHVPTDDYHLYSMVDAHPAPMAVVPPSAESSSRLRRGGGTGYVADSGPVVSGELKQRIGPKGTWWDWDDGKVALEALFHTGRLTARRRTNDFARVYDLARAHAARRRTGVATARPRSTARKELLVHAAKHHGVGTFEDLTDYHRQRNPPCRPLIAELVEEGRLIEATVEGWKQPAYLHPDAIVPRRITARALLSPFDSLVWNRARTERLFGFRYRIEIYVPAPKRQYGYYVLPFLLGDELVARVDLKADRPPAGCWCRVRGASRASTSPRSPRAARRAAFDGGLARARERRGGAAWRSRRALARRSAADDGEHGAVRGRRT